jgi:hypothetical protein
MWVCFCSDSVNRCCDTSCFFSPLERLGFGLVVRFFFLCVLQKVLIIRWPLLRIAPSALEVCVSRLGAVEYSASSSRSTRWFCHARTRGLSWLALWAGPASTSHRETWCQWMDWLNVPPHRRLQCAIAGDGRAYVHRRVVHQKVLCLSGLVEARPYRDNASQSVGQWRWRWRW